MGAAHLPLSFFSPWLGPSWPSNHPPPAQPPRRGLFAKRPSSSTPRWGKQLRVAVDAVAGVKIRAAAPGELQIPPPPPPGSPSSDFSPSPCTLRAPPDPQRPAGLRSIRRRRALSGVADHAISLPVSCCTSLCPLFPLSHPLAPPPRTTCPGRRLSSPSAELRRPIAGGAATSRSPASPRAFPPPARP
jgi:hypothetical protein